MLMVKHSSKKSQKQTNKVAFEPNKMSLAVAATAAVTLVLLALIATLN